MGIAERRQRQREEVYTSILDAAWHLVEREGWQALSIRKIADAIEYSVPVIYDHFENKEAILFEFTKKGFYQLNEDLMAAVQQHRNAERQIEAIAYAYWDFAFNNKEYYQIMYGLGMPSCDTVNQIAELKTFTQIVSEPINKLMAQNGQKEKDSFLKLHTFWSMLHGLVSINMMNRENIKRELNALVIKDFIKGFISGMKE